MANAYVIAVFFLGFSFASYVSQSSFEKKTAGRRWAGEKTD